MYMCICSICIRIEIEVQLCTISMQFYALLKLDTSTPFLQM